MKIGLIDVDSHNFPNLCLMKISACHKSQGDAVDWWNGFERYDIIYMSKIFTKEYTADLPRPHNTPEVLKGGTGYNLSRALPYEVEHIYPDYSLYPDLTKDTAYGFLTRGCPRACEFCIVADKEGRKSQKVADLSEFWRGQKIIKLLDPNLLACKEYPALLQQLIDSKAYVDFTQGVDIRLTNEDNIALINQIKLKTIHFAWDNPNEDLAPYFKKYIKSSKTKNHRRLVVYVLTNFGSTHEQDLYRIYTLRNIGFNPYVMIYDKPSAPLKTRQLQRWCNNRIIFESAPDFKDYKDYKITRTR